LACIGVVNKIEKFPVMFLPSFESAFKNLTKRIIKFLRRLKKDIHGFLNQKIPWNLLKETDKPQTNLSYNYTKTIRS